ncbi:MAG TPA: hypothetical protein VGL82_07345 [Bryobacteraceae bacterium]|jgi:hypothetical protein
MARKTGKKKPAHASAPSLDPTVSRGVYTICYYLAFGAVYGSCLAMEFIPPDSVIRHGLRDGAEAAREAWARSHEEDEVAESEMELPEDAPVEEPSPA